MKHCVVTTFNKTGYKEYGAKFLARFNQYWPTEVQLFVYLEGMKKQSEGNIVFLEQSHHLSSLLRFKSDNQAQPFANGHSPWQSHKTGFFWDAVKFSNKVFAVSHGILSNYLSFDQLIWLDADTVTHRQISNGLLDELAPQGNQLSAFLNRAIFPECGWVGYNLKHPHICEFARDFEEIYSSGNYKFLRECHDSYVFHRLIESYVLKYNVDWRALGDNTSTGHVFLNSQLGIYMDHLKGPKRKLRGASSANDLSNTRQKHEWMEVS